MDHSEDSIIESLLRTNDPPPDNLRPRLMAKLRIFQDAFQSIVGRPFTASLEWPAETLPEEIEVYTNSIQRYTSVLSIKRCFPIELWQGIFESELPPTDSVWYLQTICSVCRDWRTAAISHSPLWARLPPIDSTFNFSGHLSPQTHLEEYFTRRYLLRSGQAPLTFKFNMDISYWPTVDIRQDYGKVLQLLTDQCHRWAEADICLPIDAFNEMLSCIQGNLPMLKKLKFGAHTLSPAYSISGATEYRISCFREAPSLREVDVQAPNAFGHPSSTALTIDLPWPQLETFRTMSGKDTLCNDLIQARPSRLRFMHLFYYPHSLPALTKSPVTLPELSTLSFFTSEDGLSLTSLLDILTLPALSRLIVRGDLDVASANSMCRRLLRLIVRSKCSLQHFLFFGPIDTSPDEFFTILRLSPNLSHLAVPFINSEGLRRLVLNSTSTNDPANLVPNLKKMDLCHYRSVGSVDAESLAEMVVSRTERFFALEEGLTLFEPVMEVELNNYNVDYLETRWSRAISKIANANANTESGLADIASKMEDLLASNFISSRHRDHMDEKFHQELDREMRNMENLDLRKCQDVSVLGRRNIPYLLCSISKNPSNLIPGDRVFQFRSRARKLLDKWKPFILRDTLTSPYIWRYHETTKARLVCRSPLQDTSNAEHVEKIWQNLIGHYLRAAVAW